MMMSCYHDHDGDDGDNGDDGDAEDDTEEDNESCGATVWIEYPNSGRTVALKT